MKNTMKFIAVICMLVMVSTSTIGHTTEPVKKIVTVTFKVDGVCGDCKKRIEEAAMIKGVRFAEWDKINKVIKVIYSSKVTNQDEIEIAISNIGHDTENHKAKDSIYDALPGCCQYRGDVEIH